MATFKEFLTHVLKESADVTKERQTELDRLLLRLYSSPGLLSHLKDAKFTDDYTAEIEFAFLPKQAVDTVPAIIGPIPVEAYSYMKHSEPMHGFKFKTSDLVTLYQQQDLEKETP